MPAGKAVIGQSGGPTAVINKSLVGFIKEALKADFKEILGAKHGLQGMLNEDFVDLSKLNESQLYGIGRTPAAALGSVRKKGVDYLPEIMVLNFMSANPKKWGTYEKTELSNTKSISDNSLRVGWNFHRRIDDYGSDNYFSHVTIDWFDEYKDFLKDSCLISPHPLLELKKTRCIS